MVEFQFADSKTPGRMARVAGRAELAEMDIAMAIRARRGHGFIGSGRAGGFLKMAFLAGHGCMLAGQRKPGFAVIERGFFKAFHDMAVLAVFAVLALVGIPAVAIGAAAESDFPVLLPARMALDAGQDTMFSPQREAGLFMAEFGGFPGGLLVAGAAVFSERRLMRICVTIAAAGKGGHVPLLVRMASRASQAFVRPIEGEPGFSVVKYYLFERDLRRMAAGALPSQLTAMGIRMTGRAARILEQVASAFFPRQRIGRAMAGCTVSHFFM